MSEVNRYFYVMWPEEREASSTSSSSSSLPTRVATAVAVENGTENVVKVQGNGPIVSSTPLRLAYAHPELRNIHSSHSEDEDESPSELLIVRPTADGHDLMRTTTGRSNITATVPQVVEKATVAMASGYCTRCMIKESEIRRLRKRVEALEEQLCRALKTKRPKSLPSLDTVVGISNSSSRHSFVSTSPATSDGSECHEFSNCVEISIRDGQEVMDVDVVKGAIENKMAGGVQVQEDDKIELVPGTNLFISATRLQQILSTVKTGKQLARKLMSVFWDRNTLARSTLSASSQHYEQLDPGTVAAIKTYCVLFDNSVRKSEIHSTMIDKCVQSRRPRRSSLKRLDYQEVKISPTLILPPADTAKTAPAFTCSTAQIQAMVRSSSETDGSGEKPSD